MKKVVVFTGAGVSAESGLSTFRDSDGLWHKHRIEDVATPMAWINNMDLVLEFYNQRRKQLYEVEPNAAHYALVRLEEKFDVDIITQNVDDLHERAGSSKVLHLHGELKKARSTADPDLVYDIEGWELKRGMRCGLGSQLRPHVVWFGEPVPEMLPASMKCAAADIFIVIGTSLQVYPAAGLLNHVDDHVPVYVVDPKIVEAQGIRNCRYIRKMAGEGVPELVEELMKMEI
jgi:NAD-dependent deacetylase